MKLSEKLKTATKAEHDKLDKLSSMKRVTSDEVNLADYKNYLKAFYLIHSRIEDDVYEGCSEYIDGINSNRRMSHLINDLNKLNIDFETVVPESENQFELNNLELLGALYVIEGSRLGGKYISNHLSSQLDLDNSELKFLSAAPSMKWSVIISFLNKQPDDYHHEIIAGAKYTFQYFYDELTAYYCEKE
jgi:heme oxygenase